MHRAELSRPIARALDDGLVATERSVLDYGCGRGGDVRRLRSAGIECSGYDPVYAPDTPLEPADVVNLGYVVNVIERASERADVLRRAWSLARGALVVAARLEDEARDLVADGHRDGVVTSRGTFQMFFTQESLRAWIEATLGEAPVAAAPGIYYVFRDEQAEQAFLSRRVRRRSSEALGVEGAEPSLEPLIEFFSERGRLPRAEEWTRCPGIRESFGSGRQAFAHIRRLTGDERWDRVRIARYEDLLVYVALSRFGRRPRLSALPLSLQYDVKDFFGSYKAACEQGDRLLFSLGDDRKKELAFDAAGVGKRTQSGLYVHRAALEYLPPLLRAFEGCAQVLAGTPEQATLVKLHADRARISYLAYPAFDSEAHPALKYGLLVDLESLRVRFRDYTATKNPPILHRKELFVSKDYPLRSRFVRLTAQEERLGLYEFPRVIGTRLGWAKVLQLKGVEIKGHQAKRIESSGSTR